MRKFLLLFMGVLLLTSCGSNKTKTKIDLSEFSNIASTNLFLVNDNMDSYIDIDYILGAKKAILDDISVEMIVYTDDESTNKVQNSQINNFKTIKSTAATENREKGQNYYKFWMVSNGYYMVSSRVDDTLVFSKTLLKNKEKVEKLLEDLGY